MKASAATAAAGTAPPTGAAGEPADVWMLLRTGLCAEWTSFREQCTQPSETCTIAQCRLRLGCGMRSMDADLWLLLTEEEEGEYLARSVRAAAQRSADLVPCTAPGCEGLAVAGRGATHLRGHQIEPAMLHYARAWLWLAVVRSICMDIN